MSDKKSMPRLPSTPEEVVAFIGNHYDARHTVGAIEDHRYKLSVHDLLSSFQALADQAEEATQPAITMTPELRRELQAWGRATEGDADADESLLAVLNAARQPEAAQGDVVRSDLMELLDSVLGNCYMGNEWELERATKLKDAMAKEKQQ